MAQSPPSTSLILTQVIPRRFSPSTAKRVICLDIPDDYEFMQPELVRLLEIKVSRHLPAGQ